eukprot:jgi/Botrbrau1/4491/Bobra.0220s0025.1
MTNPVAEMTTRQLAIVSKQVRVQRQAHEEGRYNAHVHPHANPLCMWIRGASL